MSAGPLVAVTGASGRLGSAVIAALAHEGVPAAALSRPEYDLDDDGAAAAVVKRYKPGVVVHCAAWTAVDECARDPELAMRRNATAATELATACAGADARLVLISTNEVFDGERTDGRGYLESDRPNPINAYGRSKHAGELAASAAFEETGKAADLTIVRTAWLFGPPGNDFPSKVLSAADALRAGDQLRVVSDEFGSPTFAPDLAVAIVRLVLSGTSGGVYHLVNSGRASRLEVAQCVLERCRPSCDTTPISRSDFERPSQPPRWAVLESARAGAAGLALRPWREALAAYLPSLCT